MVAQVPEEFDFTGLVRWLDEAEPREVDAIGRRRAEMVAGLRRLR